MPFMQIKLLFRLLLAVLPISAFAQSSYIRIGSKDYQLLDRLEIKTRSPFLTQSFNKPYNRKLVLTAIDTILANQSSILTANDELAAKRLLNDPEKIDQKTPLYFSFRNSGLQANHNSNYILINPIVRTEFSRERNTGQRPHLLTFGIDSRGVVFNKIGFRFYATHSNERLPLYLNDWLSRYNTVPGAGNFEPKSGRRVSYWDVRGTIQTSVTKYIDLQIGYDRNFLGNGYRSLFLSDFSNSTAFIKTNIKIWKLNFQSLYMQLKPQDGIVNMKDTKKYLRINTVSADVAKWLNLSIFDAVVLGRNSGFDLNYILPVTFLRAMEQQSGSPDNALFGMNVKANLAGKVQLYGQILLDEFNLTEVKAQSGWWANKYGYQAGIKYIDALGIKDLDLQVETNRVRPFTYSHFDSVSNYSHYNQPLAHPLGANFQEFIGIVKYHPLKRLYINAKAIYYKQGLDSLGYNTGNNVLINYTSRPRDYGWEVGSGNKATCLYLSGLVSYELLNNFFIDASIINRDFKTQLSGNLKSTIISLGLRWNISRRELDF
jgi:hypothetical protein